MSYAKTRVDGVNSVVIHAITSTLDMGAIISRECGTHNYTPRGKLE
jgi:hypothetical protein